MTEWHLWRLRSYGEGVHRRSMNLLFLQSDNWWRSQTSLFLKKKKKKDKWIYIKLLMERQSYMSNCKEMNPLQSVGLVKYLPTGHLWINPHLSERIMYNTKLKTGQDEDLKLKWKRIPTYLSRSFYTAVHEEALNGVRLGHNRFLHIFFCFRSPSTSSPCEWNTLFTSRYIKQHNAANHAYLPLFSITSSSRSSSKISLPSST